MKVIKGASGFGDAIYLRAIVEWLLKNRQDDYIVLTSHPEIYSDMPVQTDILHSNKYNYDYLCTYLYTKGQDTIQWNDMLIKGKLPIFPITSSLKNRKPSDIVLVIPPYPPHNGAPKSLPMQPMKEEFLNLIVKFENIKFINRKYKFLELVELFNSAKLVIGQVGWSLPLAEMLDVPLLSIFTKRALNNDHKFISDVTPKKLLTKQTSKAIIMK